MKLSRSSSVRAAILVSALGYFVDVYDLVLFSVVRVPSLRSLGLSGDELLDVGVYLLNMQMGGMLIGGVLWGIWGDRFGRISVLFGSIFLYSVANLANAFIEGVSSYAILRFIAGVGLAGELGAGITLVSEQMERGKRGIGTTIIATVGVCGAVVASLVAENFDWRTAYIVGGVMGLALLFLRVGVHESGMFSKLKEADAPRGNLSLLFTGTRLVRYLACIGAGLPIWFVVGIFITFAPEFGRALNLSEVPSAATAILYCYSGLVVGDLASGLISQGFRSRKKVLLLFLSLTVLSSAIYLTSSGIQLSTFYFICAALGLSVGYWAVFVTTAAEQFGTNIRATAATTIPNFVRGAVVPITSLFVMLKPQLGILYSATCVGLLTVLAAAVSILALNESFEQDLDFLD